MAIAYVQDAGHRATHFSSSQSSVTVTVTSATSAGNLLVLRIGNSNNSPSTITDSRGNLWTIANKAGTTGIATLAYTFQDVAHLQINDVITITFGGTGVTSNLCAAIDEFSGVASVDISDKQAFTTTATRSCGSATTTNAADLIYCVFAPNTTGETFTQTAGYTALTSYSASGANFMVEGQYQIVAATGTYAPTATGSATVSGGGCITTFKASSAASKTVTPVGITSAETFGTARVRSPQYVYAAGGITSAQMFGRPNVAGGVAALGNQNTYGPAIYGLGVYVGTSIGQFYPAGITSAEAFGQHLIRQLKLQLTVSPVGIVSGETFGPRTVATGGIPDPRKRWRSMDSIVIYPPGASGAAGSALEVGTYLMADPGADYGARGLIQSIESSNAMRDGGAFSYRYMPPRKMAIPLVLRDVPSLNLEQAESLLRRWTTAGAYVSLLPDGTPTQQAVFFDVLDGRWEPDYNTGENRAQRRKGTLFLDTQPWGYWPTEILLASAASVGYMGQLAVPGGSVIGDVPPLARIQIIPSVASTFLVSDTGVGPSQVGLDSVALSLSGLPSFVPFIPAGSFFPQKISFSGVPAGNSTGVLAADQFAPASNAIFWNASTTSPGNHPGWTLAAFGAIPSALEPAYRGRFRAFAFMKFSPASAARTMTFSAILDAERGGFPSPMNALASSNQLATLGAASSPIVNTFIVASNAYQILDMGEFTLPAGGGSGMQEAMRLRLWLNATTPNTYGATVGFGGVYLLPADGAAGVLTRGGMVPTISGNPIPGGVGLATQAGFEWNSRFSEEMYLVNTQPGIAAPAAQPQVYADGKAFYRGVAPRIGASTNQLTFLTSDRIGNNFAVPQQAYQGSVEYSKVSVSYRPTFQFLYGI